MGGKWRGSKWGKAVEIVSNAEASQQDSHLSNFTSSSVVVLFSKKWFDSFWSTVRLSFRRQSRPTHPRPDHQSNWNATLKRLHSNFVLSPFHFLPPLSTSRSWSTQFQSEVAQHIFNSYSSSTALLLTKTASNLLWSLPNGSCSLTRLLNSPPWKNYRNSSMN